jgi:hypothetical protein
MQSATRANADIPGAAAVKVSNTSPAPSATIALASALRSVTAPLTANVNTAHSLHSTELRSPRIELWGRRPCAQILTPSVTAGEHNRSPAAALLRVPRTHEPEIRSKGTGQADLSRSRPRYV